MFELRLEQHSLPQERNRVRVLALLQSPDDFLVQHVLRIEQEFALGFDGVGNLVMHGRILSCCVTRRIGCRRIVSPSLLRTETREHACQYDQHDGRGTRLLPQQVSADQ